MSDYNWCHGPECHEKQTQSRVRGSGRDKVLRTMKIKQGRYNGDNYERVPYTATRTTIKSVDNDNG